METIKKAWKWLTTHTKILFLIIGVIFLFILVVWWGKRNKSIRALQRKISYLQAKLKIEKLQMKYDMNMEELVSVRDQNEHVREDLKKIEDDLVAKFEKDLTAEEIAQKFRELGL